MSFKSMVQRQLPTLVQSITHKCKIVSSCLSCWPIVQWQRWVFFVGHKVVVSSILRIEVNITALQWKRERKKGKRQSKGARLITFKSSKRRFQPCWCSSSSSWNSQKTESERNFGRTLTYNTKLCYNTMIWVNLGLPSDINNKQFYNIRFTAQLYKNNI